MALFIADIKYEKYFDNAEKDMMCTAHLKREYEESKIDSCV